MIYLKLGDVTHLNRIIGVVDGADGLVEIVYSIWYSWVFPTTFLDTRSGGS